MRINLNEKKQRIYKYEEFYIRITWFIIASCFIYIILRRFDNADHYSNTKFLYGIIFSCVLLVMNFLKFYVVKKKLFIRPKVYYSIRCFELFLTVFGAIFLDASIWLFLTLLFPIIITSICKGNKPGIILTIYTYLTLLVLRFISMSIMGTENFLNYFTSERFIFGFWVFFIMALFTNFYGEIYKEDILKDKENDDLLLELRQKYDQLEIAQSEIKYHYEKLKVSNSMLEDTNKRLTGSIAEFYTLQQITQAISSIFDINELLKYVNDIILGVMGVNYSSIILFDEKKGRLKCHITNIRNKKEFAVFTDNINSETFIEVLNETKPIIENFVDPEFYKFTNNREVNSLICIPLYTKSKKYGVVLIEHKHYNAFDEENLRLLGIIGQQVSVALENAQLYQQMQEMAMIDGLTKIFNRLYFQDRLSLEIVKAKELDYNLSIIIFDIDDFKRFNDTFGHLFGDEVLKTIVSSVKFNLRKEDVFARYGGEEFIILLPRTSLSDAYEKAEELRVGISKTAVKDNLITASITVSIGVSTYPQCVGNENELLKTADDALYEAKAAGRNCVKITNDFLEYLK